MNLIDQARQFAHDAHDSIKQVRKYTNEPYWTHAYDVADLVERYYLAEQSIGADTNIICAAFLHDVLEDVAPVNPDYNAFKIYKLFGPCVLDLVLQLTDQFTKEAFPGFNRATRKKLECAKWERCEPDAKTVKLADLISNTKSIVKHDPEFARTYLAEKWELLPKLLGGLYSLHKDATTICSEGIQKLNLILP